MRYAEDLILDYLQDELIRNPFPLPMDHVLDYVYSLNKKGKVVYMAENLEKAVKKFVETSDRLTEAGSHHYTEFYMHELADDVAKAKTQVEAEVYRAIGNSAYKGISDKTVSEARAMVEQILNKR